MRLSSNRKKVERAVRASMARFERTFSARIQNIIEETDRYIKSLTPVHTGETVRNYIWTTGTPFAGVLSPIDTGDPGRTNSMPLGVEPRRDANERAAAESIRDLNLSNPFQNFILTNNAPAVAGLEYGLLPEPPFRSRSPNGMFGLTHAYIMITIRARGFSS